MVALKFLSTAAVSAAGQRDAGATALDHPNICIAHDIGEREGQTLKQRIGVGADRRVRPAEGASRQGGTPLLKSCRPVHFPLDKSNKVCYTSSL
jgi:hypothetical protein